MEAAIVLVGEKLVDRFIVWMSEKGVSSREIYPLHCHYLPSVGRHLRFSFLIITELQWQRRCENYHYK